VYTTCQICCLKGMVSRGSCSVLSPGTVSCHLTSSPNSSFRGRRNAVALPQYVKSLVRKGQALQELRCHREASATLKRSSWWTLALRPASVAGSLAAWSHCRPSLWYFAYQHPVCYSQPLPYLESAHEYSRFDPIQRYLEGRQEMVHVY
jgi:hypothetical protein